MTIEIEQTELASGVHGEIAVAISSHLFMHVKANRLGRVFDGRTTFQIAPDQPKREPDVSFVTLERLPQNIDDTIPLAPDLAVEIISSNDDWKEIIKKAAAYLNAGVRLVWVIDPYSRAAFVFRPQTDTAFQTLREAQELDGEEVVPGFKVAVSTIFEEAGPLQTGI